MQKVFSKSRQWRIPFHRRIYQIPVCKINVSILRNGLPSLGAFLDGSLHAWSPRSVKRNGFRRLDISEWRLWDRWDPSKIHALVNKLSWTIWVLSLKKSGSDCKSSVRSSFITVIVVRSSFILSILARWVGEHIRLFFLAIRGELSAEATSHVHGRCGSFFAFAQTLNL